MTILVFESNLAGHHEHGAARRALLHYGARWGRSSRLQGNSYGIPTKDQRGILLPIELIKTYVDGFLEYAKEHPEDEFLVTPIGTDPEMFLHAPKNCILPEKGTTIETNKDREEELFKEALAWHRHLEQVTKTLALACTNREISQTLLEGCSDVLSNIAWEMDYMAKVRIAAGKT